MTKVTVVIQYLWSGWSIILASGRTWSWIRVPISTSVEMAQTKVEVGTYLKWSFIHIGRFIKVWMKDHEIKNVSRPAQSPDLNPIKNLLNVIKSKINGQKPSNKAELLYAISGPKK